MSFDMDSCSISVLDKHDLSSEYFAEGSTLAANNKIYQLTYKENKVFEWDYISDKKLKLSEIKKMPAQSSMYQGWGLAYKNEGGRNLLYATDGTSNIYIIDQDTWT